MMSPKGKDEIIFIDIKQQITWRGEQIDGGRHVKEMMIFIIIYWF